MITDDTKTRRRFKMIKLKDIGNFGSVPQIVNDIIKEIPNDYNLYNYIFSFGDGAEVLEPKEIRMQIKEMINKMAEKYILSFRKM